MHDNISGGSSQQSSAGTSTSAVSTTSSDLEALEDYHSCHSLTLPTIGIQRPLPLYLTHESHMSDTMLVYHHANAYGHVDPNQVGRFRYVVGTDIPERETRHVEFKDYRNFIKRLVRVLGKYMCAFLNTEGGLLVIGVQDNGLVVGVNNVNRQVEAQIRQDVDGVMQKMTPSVPPRSYRVSFLDVYDKEGKLVPDRKILEIEVEQGTAAPNLYRTGSDKVYMKMDASVHGPLSHEAVTQWYQHRLTRIQREERRRKLLEEEQIKKTKRTQVIATEARSCDVLLPVSDNAKESPMRKMLNLVSQTLDAVPGFSNNVG